MYRRIAAVAAISLSLAALAGCERKDATAEGRNPFPDVTRIRDVSPALSDKIFDHSFL